MDEVERANDRLEALRLEQEWFDNITEPMMSKSLPPPPPKTEVVGDYFGSDIPLDTDNDRPVQEDGDDGGIFKLEMND